MVGEFVCVWKVARADKQRGLTLQDLDKLGSCVGGDSEVEGGPASLMDDWWITERERISCQLNGKKSGRTDVRCP
jgi:hypothetical protein